MEQVSFSASLVLDYPDPRTADALHGRLFPWTALAPAYPEALWHMATALPHVLINPSPSFATAEWFLFCRYEAARRVFDPITGYDGLILQALIDHPIQIAGVYFEHLRFRVLEYLLTHGLTEWPDCLGRSRFKYGRVDTTPAKLAANRTALLGVIDSATLWYERTLAHIALSKSLDERSSSRELHYWVAGAEMPAPIVIQVLSMWKGGTRLIFPNVDESKPFVTYGWPLPSYPVEVEATTPAPASTPGIPPAPAAPTPAPTAGEIAAARMLQSGLLVTAGPLLERMKPNDRELANYLLSYKHPARKIPLSYAEIGRLLGCSDEAVRRRQRSLEKKHPALRGIITATRTRNRKGVALPPIPGRQAFEANPDPR
ncbi:MAG: hypothetical protein KJ579_11505 [Verrucomicrobia bacterium]|nr:hypothetical protein [Verrucomicrobiota bacterium]